MARIPIAASLIGRGFAPLLHQPVVAQGVRTVSDDKPPGLFHLSIEALSDDIQRARLATRSVYGRVRVKH